MKLLLLVSGLACLLAWLVLGFIVPVGAGWPHLFLPAGVLLLMRRVVAGGGGR
jgi:hypothetical protein